MKVAIMQPYFFPYIGYFQLISAVDTFVVYDNIEYTKKGWINRNRILQNGNDALFSLPLKKDSDFLDVYERSLASDFQPEKLINQFRGSYAKAPFFKDVHPLITEVLQFPDRNLFNFINNSIKKTCEYLSIKTQIIESSKVSSQRDLKGQDRVLELCRQLNADVYINSIGGLELYSKRTFEENKIHLNFLKPQNFTYPQFKNDFVPWLSIVDVMMFNSKDQVKDLLQSHFSLIEGI